MIASRMEINKILTGFLFLFVSSQTFGIDNNKEFPGRQLYPDVPYIELADFFEKYNHKQVIAVDVRSSSEFNTLKIKNAINIPVSSYNFLTRLQKLRKTEDRPIVLYCNGKTCMKSYKATRKAIKGNIKDVMAYDAGIMDFAKSYPKLTVLLGKPLGSAKKIISKKRFQQHLISPSNFDKRVADSSDILIDLRERIQRQDGISYFIGREHRVTLDNTAKLDKYINQAKKEKKALLVYDAAGKQVRWLQYYLEEKALRDYYFMDGGITAYYNAILPSAKN